MSSNIQSGGVFMEQQEPDGLLLVEAYGGGGFRFRSKRIEGSVIVIGNSYYPVAASSLSDLTEADFDQLVGAEEQPEILFVGTGAKMQLLPADMRKFLQSKGFNPELMDTGAAARTFNVLRMEDRRVAALLLQVD